MTSNKNNKFTDFLPAPSKIAQKKIYDYIKKIEVDGLPRVRAYAEAIDPRIYELPPNKIADKLDAVRTYRSDYKELEEMVRAEQKDWILRRSAVIQDKAVSLLANVIDKANELASKPETDVKELSAAIATLKTIMPALTVNNNNNTDNSNDRKARASKFIN